MSTRNPYVGTVGWLAFAAALGALVVAMVRAPANYYGTARAPYSDSLTSWVQGTLDLYFNGTSSTILLFRPTVPVLHSSILTLTGDLGAVPLVFTGIAAACAVAAFAALGMRGRLALAALLVALLAHRGILIDALNVNSLNTELIGFAFGFGGLLLAGAGLRRGVRTGRVAPLLFVGFAMIGITATVRGTMLAALPALVLFGWWVLARAGAAAPAAVMAGALGCGLLPYAVDAGLLAGLDVRSPGLLPFFALYWDPQHTLTNEAYFAFTASNPSAAEVLRHYLAFVFSGQGLEVLSGFLAHRLAGDAAYLGHWELPGLALAVLAGGLLLGRADGRADGGTGRGEPGLLAWRLAVLAAVAALTVLPPLVPGVPRAAPMAALLVLLLAGALLRRLLFTGLFTLAYLGGVAFLVLTGTVTYDRVLSSFLFCAYGAVLWAMVERPAVPPAGARVPGGTVAEAGAAGERVLATALAAVLAALYLANPLIDTGLKRTFAEQVRGRPMAIKVSEDAGLDRSLYYGSGTELLYTRRDDRPIGTVRPLAAFVNPTGRSGAGGSIDGARLANALFEQPGWFAE